MGRRAEDLEIAASAQEALQALRSSRSFGQRSQPSAAGRVPSSASGCEEALRSKASWGEGVAAARSLWFDAAALAHKTHIRFPDPRGLTEERAGNSGCRKAAGASPCLARPSQKPDGHLLCFSLVHPGAAAAPSGVPFVEAEDLAAAMPRRALLGFKLKQLRAELKRQREAARGRSFSAEGSESCSDKGGRAGAVRLRSPLEWVEMLLPLQPGVCLALPGLFLEGARREGDSEETALLAAVEAFGAQAEEAGEVCVVDCRTFEQVESAGNQRLQPRQAVALNGDALIELLAKKTRDPAEEESLAQILRPLNGLRGRLAVCLLGAGEVPSRVSSAADSALRLHLVEDDPVEALAHWTAQTLFPNVAVVEGGWRGGPQTGKLCRNKQDAFFHG